MFNKLIGRLFARANTRRKQKYADARKETANALRMFRDTLRALVMANETGQDALELIDQEVGWYRLLRAKPVIEAMVSEADPDRFCYWRSNVINPMCANIRFDLFADLRVSLLPPTRSADFGHRNAQDIE